MASKERLIEIIENKKRFSYTCETLRRIKPECLSVSYKLVDVLKLTFRAEDNTIEISFLPEEKSIRISLNGFEECINVISKKLFHNSNKTSKYIIDGTSIFFTNQTLDNLLIKQDKTEIVLGSTIYCKISVNSLCEILGKIKTICK